MMYNLGYGSEQPYELRYTMSTIYMYFKICVIRRTSTQSQFVRFSLSSKTVLSFRCVSASDLESASLDTNLLPHDSLRAALSAAVLSRMRVAVSPLHNRIGADVNNRFDQ